MQAPDLRKPVADAWTAQRLPACAALAIKMDFRHQSDYSRYWGASTASSVRTA